MVAVAGTYKVAGKNKEIVHEEAAWNQTLLGSDLPRDFKVSGKHLTVTFTAKSPVTGQDVQVTVNGERIE